jgi:hypothetical protein
MGSLLNVAAAIVGVYIILALITSHITEQIGAMLDMRGQKLYDGIKALVTDAQALQAAAGKQPDALVTYIYEHPLISNISASPKHKPSYIPTRVFTLSFIDGVRDIFTHDSENNVLRLPEILAAPPELLADLARRAGGMPDGNLKRTLVTVLQNNDSTYEGALKGIDALFDSAMQRVSGWYKRWAAAVLAVVGAIIVIALNADTIAIIQSFSASPAQTAAYVSAVEKLGNNASVAELVRALPPIDLAWHFPLAGGWWPKIVGLLLTWFAVLLGAPFWFSLLQTIVPVRLSGDKPAPATGTPSTRDVRDVQSAATG